MKKTDIFIKTEKRERLLFLLILGAGLFARVFLFGRTPGGINQDEAFAAYEAYSLLHYGIDSAGYSFPVYLTAWGSGMNALESYLMIPFIALFGLETWVIRLPQLIVGLLSLWAVYLVTLRIADRRAALWAMFLLAICPWHVLLCRWGLESNLAPGFLLFGLHFFLLGLENSRYFLLSGLMYGLALYAYAAIWPFVPLIIILQFVYCLRRGRLRADGFLLGGGLILLLLALPLLLFLAVNFRLMEELRLPFMSIPRLLYMRSGDISFSNIPENLATLFRLLLFQSDGLPWNYAEGFGLIYNISLPFALIGLVHCAKRLREGRGEFCPETLLLIQLLAGLALGMLIEVNVNRVNIIFIPLVMLTALGLCRLGALLKGRLLKVLIGVYALCFVCFEVYYFTDYRELMDRQFGYGLEEAVEAVADWEGMVYLSADISYPKLLFYSREPVEEYIQTVEYTNYPAAFLNLRAFGRYRFGFDEGDIAPGACYIFSGGMEPAAFMEAGYRLEKYGAYTVALPE